MHNNLNVAHSSNVGRRGKDTAMHLCETQTNFRINFRTMVPLVVNLKVSELYCSNTTHLITCHDVLGRTAPDYHPLLEPGIIEAEQEHGEHVIQCIYLCLLDPFCRVSSQAG